MKKIIMSLFAVMMAATALAGSNKTMQEARIYINPGHGSWTSNDRNMATINHSTGDTTGFYESNTNLWKGLKLRQTLIDWGVPESNIMMSRVKNGPDPNSPTASAESTKYNRNLTEIAQEANSFNSDYFLSIHSDAGTGTLNVALLIHKGYTTPAADSHLITGSYGSLELQTMCREMATTMWPYLTSNGIDVMSSYSPRIVGDLTFYYQYTSPADNTGGKAGYLGVLRTNTCPGFLSEGYCHTYEPATHRALNPDYCGQEGVRYARGMAKWFGWDEPESTGYIMGSVKDLHEHLYHQLYTFAENSIDQWKPINGAVVTLYKGGVEVAKYTCDDEWNGVFVFEKLEPGDDYTIDAVADGYKSVFDLDEEYAREATKYTVVANETTYPVIQLEASDYVAYPCYNYPEPDQDRWLGLADEYAMRQDYVDKTISVLDGKTIRRELAHGDSLYVLALEQDSTPHIYIINSKTQELYKELSTEGIGAANDENEVLKISDIAFTSDSILVACNSVKTSFTPSGVFRVYAWGKDQTTRTPTGDPKEWFTSSTNYTSGNFTSAVTGNTLAVTGRYENCKVITTAQTTGATGELRFPIFTLTRKGLIETIRNQDPSTNRRFTIALIGEDYKLCVSPRDDNAFVIDGSNTTPIECAMVADVQAPTLLGQVSADVMTAATNGVTFFKYAKHILMTAPKLDADGKNVGVVLYDVTNGLDKAELVGTSNTDLAASEATHMMVSSHVEEADITLYLHKDNTVSRFTTQDVEQTYYNNVFAYDLKVTTSDGNYIFTFSVNDDCLNGGKLLFFDATTGEAVGEIVLDNVVAGVNEKTVAAADIPGTENQILNWSVEVSSKKVAIIMPLLERGGDYALNRGYAAVNNSTESPYFGHVYVSDYAGANKATNGIYEYDAIYNKKNTTAYNGGVSFNANTQIVIDENGYVYVADKGTSNSGVYVADPDYLSVTMNQYFEGTRTSGIIKNNDVEVAGATSSISIYGKGADAKMYAYMKNSSGKYVINVYNIGKADGTLASSWGVAPDTTLSLPVKMGDDATIVAVEQGVWVGQTKTVEGNAENSPALMFVYKNGIVTFNQALAQYESMLNGNGGSALAISKDEKTLVVNDCDGVLRFFDVQWDGAVPVLTEKYNYTHEIGVGASRIQDGVYIEQMSFDYAGHLVASGHYLGVYTIPTDDNTCVTPARSWMTVTSKVAASGIVDVAGDDANAPVEYYNLQGIKVANPSNGVFIKKQGNKAIKVVR